MWLCVGVPTKSLVSSFPKTSHPTTPGWLATRSPTGSPSAGVGEGPSWGSDDDVQRTHTVRAFVATFGLAPWGEGEGSGDPQAWKETVRTSWRKGDEWYENRIWICGWSKMKPQIFQEVWEYQSRFDSPMVFQYVPVFCLQDSELRAGLSWMQGAAVVSGCRCWTASLLNWSKFGQIFRVRIEESSSSHRFSEIKV